MKKYVIIALAVVVMGLGVLYVYLGGLNSIEYTVENVDNYHLVGRMFQGKADAKEIEDYFFEAKDFAIGGTIDGELTILHYNDTTLAKKEIKLFIGVLLNNAADTLDLPAGYALVKVPAQKTIRATILANNAVIPGPETIEAKLKEKAEETGLIPQSFTIEKYLSETEMEIDMPVKN
ncbi:hypothetical protein [Roseivirga seohaensis]|uniref:hypothetical protein n=1 Tax=Roseivirga seohaensis TaxID=1914963 RepID=UPI003BAD836C